MQRIRFSYAVETYPGNILNMHKREWEGNGFLSTWSMRGCLPCWEGSNWESSASGRISDSGSMSIEQAIQKVTINTEVMNKHMIWCYNMMWLVLMCWRFNLNGMYCKGIANSNSKFDFKICHMHICSCYPILKCLNMETNCIFRFLGFFWWFFIYKLFSSELWFKRYCKFHF